MKSEKEITREEFERLTYSWVTVGKGGYIGRMTINGKVFRSQYERGRQRYWMEVDEED